MPSREVPTPASGVSTLGQHPERESHNQCGVKLKAKTSCPQWCPYSGKYMWLSQRSKHRMKAYKFLYAKSCSSFGHL